MEENNELFDFEGLESFLLKSEEEKDEIKSETNQGNIDNPENVENEEVENETDEVNDEEEEVVNTDADSEIYKVVSTMLKEKGFLDEDADSLDALQEKIESKFSKTVEDWKDSLPEEIKQLVDKYEVGVPLDELIKIKSEQTRLSNIDDDRLESDVDLQKTLVTNYLKNKNFSEVKINKYISKAEDLDELLDEAKEALEDLKENEAKKEVELEKQVLAERKAAEEDYKKTINELNEKVKTTNEILPGIKLSDKEKQDLVKSMTTYSEIRGDQYLTKAMIKREEDPIGFEMKLNYYINQGLFDKEVKTTIIQKKAETKAVSKFEKQIEDAVRRKQSKQEGFSVDTNPAKDSEALKALTSIFKK
jgi:hypothetical protein